MMSTTNLHAIRETLNQIIAEAAADLEQREKQVAEAAEQLSVDSRVKAAWLESQQAERSRIVNLIDAQLQQLSGAGMNAISLRTLRRMVING